MDSKENVQSKKCCKAAFDSTVRPSVCTSIFKCCLLVRKFRCPADVPYDGKEKTSGLTSLLDQDNKFYLSRVAHTKRCSCASNFRRSALQALARATQHNGAHNTTLFLGSERRKTKSITTERVVTTSAALVRHRFF